MREDPSEGGSARGFGKFGYSSSADVRICTPQASSKKRKKVFLLIFGNGRFGVYLPVVINSASSCFV